MTPPLWNDRFYDLFRELTGRYIQKRESSPLNRNGFAFSTDFFGEEEAAFLASVGSSPQELFTDVASYAQTGSPSPSTVLLIAAVRRDFLLTVQHGSPVPSGKLVTGSQLPSFVEELAGISYLPRLIAKAQAKLQGLLVPDIHYNCQHDRQFLAEHGNIHPADFLRLVWAAQGDPMPVYEHIIKHTPANPEQGTVE